MAFRPFQWMRHLLAALVLLCGFAVGGELYLKVKQPAIPSWVCGNTACDLQPLLVPSEHVHHQLASDVSRQLEVHGQRIGFRLNRLGLRGDEVVIPKTPGTFRILVLGDDTIFGAAVDEIDCFSSRLESLLSQKSTTQIEVINGGVPGNCPLLSWLQWDHQLQSIQADLVIVHFDMTDVADDAGYRSLLTEDASEDGMSFRVAHESFLNPVVKKQPQGAAILQSLRSTAFGSLILARSRDLLRTSSMVTSSLPVCSSPIAWALDNPPDLRIQVRHAMEPLVRIKTALAGSESRLLVSTSPCFWQIVAGSDQLPCGAECQIRQPTPLQSRLPFEVLSKFCAQNEIRFVDTSDAFRQFERSELLFSAADGRISRYGLALYAKSVAAYLVQSPPRTWDP